MKCKCGSSTFEVSAVVTFVVDTEKGVAYMREFNDYRGGECVRCGEIVDNEGDILEYVEKVEYDIDKYNETIYKAKYS